MSKSSRPVAVINYDRTNIRWILNIVISNFTCVNWPFLAVPHAPTSNFVQFIQNQFKGNLSVYRQLAQKLKMQNHKSKLQFLKFSGTKWFISWTMFMWFCVAPGRNYMYFEDENKNADFLPEAVFSIIASIFGWFYFFTEPKI